jgi:hypothetical protein
MTSEVAKSFPIVDVRTIRRLEMWKIPHAEQRYDTVGDYQTFDYGTHYVFSISDLKDWRKEAAVFLHEFVEAMLCKDQGITIEQIDAWDFGHPDSDDPGALLDCPYGRQHKIAEALERFFVRELGLRWEEHEEACRAAGESRPKRPDGEVGGIRATGAGLLDGSDRGLPPLAGAEGGGGCDLPAQEGGPVQA